MFEILIQIIGKIVNPRNHGEYFNMIGKNCIKLPGYANYINIDNGKAYEHETKRKTTFADVIYILRQNRRRIR